ncbi:ATP synthase subunit B family protein [Aliterella atlantica]|uniref:Uncharacterized protein n=1 Tax=Aliterella atlantica CENA595 TaxID=1618023 RepID=A0A0D8ZXB5_9CYAN|nr:hypothetical protein [Aliterella atlantica]KJH73408.1 hypothetical protein UH38_01120 [Aliterella atlantica CENA595]
MSRQDLTNIEPTAQNIPSPPSQPSINGTGGVDIQQELNRLEETILASPNIPLTRRTLVDEERLLDQLDLVRMHLPIVFREAEALISQKQEIILQAQLEAEQIIEAAKIRAAQLVNQTEIFQQAEQAAMQLQAQVQQECQLALEQNHVEIDQMRLQAQQELTQMRQNAIAEALEIQQGADTYADNSLKNIEQQLQDMLQIIQNGRRQLQQPMAE